MSADNSKQSFLDFLEKLKIEKIGNATKLKNIEEKIQNDKPLSKDEKEYFDDLIKQLKNIKTPKISKDTKAVIAGLAIYLLFFISVTSFLLGEFVPIELKEVKDGTETPLSAIKYVIPQINLNKGVQTSTHFVVLVILGGTLGGSIHGLAKLAENTRRGSIKQRDTLWYIARPFLGVALALTVYVAIRGGIITTVGVEALNPYGITAISIMVGLSSDIVTQKLKEILAALFPSGDKRAQMLEVLQRRLTSGDIDDAKYEELKKHLDDELTSK